MSIFKNRTVIGVICILLALVICFGITPLFNQSISQKAEIVRVTKDIHAGELITKDMVTTAEVGSYNLPSGILREKDNVVGKYAKADLAVGDYILAAKLSDAPAAENAYLYNLDGTKQAISVTIKSFATGLSGKLQSGDIVSVIVADYPEDGETTIPAELQYVEIISVTASTGYDANTGEAKGDEKELPSILLKNPADKVDRPKKNVFHGSFYSEEEMLTLFDAVSGDPLELCVKIAAYYGLRRSEVLGLRWSAIDMEHKTISISHKVIEAEVDGKFVPMGEDVLKTKSSFRTLPLIPAVGIILLEEKEKQEMYRRLFKKSYCRDYLDYICVDQCGKLLRPNYVTEHFSWLIEKYGLRKVRFHDLRHTCASLLLSNGISMKQIQIWLGHSTFSTTADIYAHLDYSAQEASANAMNGMFNRPEKEEQLA